VDRQIQMQYICIILRSHQRPTKDSFTPDALLYALHCIEMHQNQCKRKVTITYLHLVLLGSNETNGLIGMSVICCSLHCKNSFIVGIAKTASDKKWGDSKAGKPWTVKSGGLEPSSLTEVMPMCVLTNSMQEQ